VSNQSYLYYQRLLTFVTYSYYNEPSCNQQEVATVIIIDPVLVLLFAFWLVFLTALIVFLAGSGS
jgi:hypothetical protein